MKLASLKFWSKKPALLEDAPLEAPHVVRVLMVCSGNICRSPTAEAVLRAKLRQAGLGRKVAVDSAGTHGYHISEPPDPRAIEAAKRRGYELSHLRARSVIGRDFERFHWILAMDRKNLEWLNAKAEKLAGSWRPQMVLMLGQTKGLPVDEVPDPYYGGADGFEQVLDLLEPACEVFAMKLARLPAPPNLGPF